MNQCGAAGRLPIEFIWARVLRIFPALLTMLLLTIFVLGILFTSLPLSSYMTDSKTYLYFLKCSTLITGVAYSLPGVFDGNPYKNAVNGSLWTLPYELRMYAILVFVWIVLRITKPNRIRVFELAIVFAASVTGIAVVAIHFISTSEWLFTKLFFMFFSGASFYVLKERIKLSRSYFWLFVVALFLSAFTNTHIFFVVYTLTLAYVLFYLAYVPSGHIRKYNQLGDYSYGIYIYAFPVQQSVAALIPGVSVFIMAMFSIAVTLIFAVFSWHFLERRALGLKGIYVDHTERILNFRNSK